MAGISGPGIIDDGLIFYVDAKNTKSYIGSGTTWSDLVGTNNGTINSATFDSSGHFIFDGTNDYINHSFDFTGLTALSVDTWAYQSSQDSFNTIVGQWKDSNFSVSSVVLETVGSEMWFIIANGGSLFSAKKTGFTTGAWHHVVGTWDGSTVRVYVDGSIGGTTASTSTMNDSSLPTLIGGIQTSGGGYVSGDWNGKVANAKIYNRVLTAGQILQNYNAHKSRFI